MKHFAAITTCQRPGEETLSASYASIVLAGWENPMLCIDGPMDIPSGVAHAPAIRATAKSKAIGAFGNFRLALASGLLFGGDATHFAIFQDDIEVCAGLLKHLETNMPQTDGVVSLYTPAPLHLEGVSKWHTDDRVHTGGWGALGYIFSREAARHFLQTVSEWADMTSANLTDYWVGQWAFQNERPYLIHSPSFIRHTGTESAIGYGRNDSIRQCKEWCADVDHLDSYDRNMSTP